MAKTKTPKLSLTTEEESAVFNAATRTWSEVYSAAEELGSVDVDTAIELVIDANRIVDIGGLNKDLYDRLLDPGYDVVASWLKRNRKHWY